MKDLSIKMKLSGFALSSLFGFVTLLFMLYIGINASTSLGSANTLVKEIDADMLTLRKNEKDFEARKDLKYKDDFQKNVVKIKADLLSLKNILNDFSIDTRKIDSLEKVIEEYKVIFLSLVDKQIQIGLDEKSGLNDSLRNSVHKVQENAKNSNSFEILSLVLELRKEEKDFMLRRDMKYVENFISKVEKLIQKANNTDKKNLEDYRDAFLMLTKAESEIGLDPKSGIQNNMRETIHKTETLLEEMGKTLNSEIQKQVKNEKILSLVIGLLLIIVVISLSFFILKNITNSLSNIQLGLNSFFSFLNRETQKAELINLDSKDEFGQMATAINSNILAIEKGLIADASAVANAVEVANKIKAGYLNEQITVTPNNPQLVELRNVLNEMLQTLASKISHDLNELEQVFQAYVASDFTARIKNPKGQVDIITNSLGNEISTMLSSSLTNGIELQSEAGTLKQAVETLSTASNQQAASLEETAAAMEEMTSNVQNNVQKSNEMATMANQTDNAAKDGAELAKRTSTAMTEIQSATNSINDAVAIIENIAFQTNILSLNAAVEAATAGDAGKGFAVVAQEVRNLANRSADAAKEIKTMAALAANKSNEGMNIATELTRGFEVIADKIAQTAIMVQDVSNANREQMQGIGQINTAVTQLDQMTQENAKVAAQADAIANATIQKAQAMVEDTLSKEFIGKNEISYI